MTRAVFVNNEAGTNGGAIAISGARWDSSEFGNVLMVRNKASVGGGFFGTRATFVHSTIAENVGGAIRLSKYTGGGMSPERSKLTLLNTIFWKNDTNCPPSLDQSEISVSGTNIEFPGGTCEASLITEDPVLDSMYVPAIGSVARYKADISVCKDHELINGKDVFGESRDTGFKCTIGAVERDLQRHAISALADDREHQQQPIGKFLEILVQNGVQNFPGSWGKER